MTPGTKVRHLLRPDLGVGVIRDTVKSEVYVITWAKTLPDSDRHIWGYYLRNNLEVVS